MSHPDASGSRFSGPRSLLLSSLPSHRLLFPFLGSLRHYLSLRAWSLLLVHCLASPPDCERCPTACMEGVPGECELNTPANQPPDLQEARCHCGCWTGLPTSTSCPGTGEIYLCVSSLKISASAPPTPLPHTPFLSTENECFHPQKTALRRVDGYLGSPSLLPSEQIIGFPSASAPPVPLIFRVLPSRHPQTGSPTACGHCQGLSHSFRKVWLLA